MSEMVERVGDALAEACQKEFGSTWSNDVRWRFARAAIEAIDAGLRDLLKGEFSSLTIGFNDASAPNYCSVAKRDKAIAENSEWSLQWYPDTPVGFYCVKASSLTAILDAALQEKE